MINGYSALSSYPTQQLSDEAMLYIALPDELLEAGINNSNTAKHIISTPELYQKLASAEEQLDSELFIDRLILTNKLIKLAMKQEYVAIRMLARSDDFSEQLDDIALGLLGAQYPDTALWILGKSEFLNKLTGYGLSLMGKPHLKTAQFILKETSLCQKLSTDNLVLISSSHIETAILVCELCKQSQNQINLTPEQLSDIANHHLMPSSSMCPAWTAEMLYSALTGKPAYGEGRISFYGYFNLPSL